MFREARYRRLLAGVVAACFFLLFASTTLDKVAAQSAAPSIPALPRPQPGYVYPTSETLTYAVDWRVFPAGTAVLHVESAGNMERVIATADSYGAVNLIYRVADKFQSSFDRTTGCSAGFSKQTIEGRRQVNTDLKFDYAQGKARLDEKNLVTGTGKHQEAPLPSCVTDLLSATFFAASQPMRVGQSFQIPVGDAIHTVAVTLKAEGKEQVKTPSGTYQTIRVQPTADAGVVKARGEIWIWYTDDAKHTPVQMRARLFWGTITFRLTSLESK
ncbi:MAG TPA: DUF3108 domain-containing protein [Acidisarcina sp.]